MGKIWYQVWLKLQISFRLKVQVPLNMPIIIIWRLWILLRLKFQILLNKPIIIIWLRFHIPLRFGLHIPPIIIIISKGKILYQVWLRLQTLFRLKVQVPLNMPIIIIWWLWILLRLKFEILLNKPIIIIWLRVHIPLKFALHIPPIIIIISKGKILHQVWLWFPILLKMANYG